MDLKDFLPGLKGVLKFVEAAAPMAGKLGGPLISNVADMAATAAAVGRNVMTRVEEGAAVMSDGDQKEVKQIVDKLAAVNDDLAAQIAAS